MGTGQSLNKQTEEEGKLSFQTSPATHRTFRSMLAKHGLHSSRPPAILYLLYISTLLQDNVRHLQTPPKQRGFWSSSLHSTHRSSTYYHHLPCQTMHITPQHHTSNNSAATQTQFIHWRPTHQPPSFCCFCKVVMTESYPSIILVSVSRCVIICFTAKSLGVAKNYHNDHSPIITVQP